MQNEDDDEEQIRVWEILYVRIKDTLDEFGREDWLGHGDYWIISDNWGTAQHKVYIDNLDLLAPSIVKLLQNILADFPDWEIVVAIDFKDKGLSWPNMGLTIRAHEIISAPIFSATIPRDQIRGSASTALEDLLQPEFRHSGGRMPLCNFETMQ
jgi:hypothetical protein